MDALYLKAVEECNELSFAILKYRANPTQRNALLLQDEMADVKAAINAMSIKHGLSMRRIKTKTRKYNKLAEKKQ